MGMRKIRGREAGVRKITRTGEYTYYVTIPKQELDFLGWREREKVSVRRAGKKIVIEKAKPE